MFLIKKNDVEIFMDGMEKFNVLMVDIKKVQYFIYIEYYVFVMDYIGIKILNLLEEKVVEGVEVWLFYDVFGLKGIKVYYLNELKKNGGFV